MTRARTASGALVAFLGLFAAACATAPARVRTEPPARTEAAPPVVLPAPARRLAEPSAPGPERRPDPSLDVPLDVSLVVGTKAFTIAAGSFRFSGSEAAEALVAPFTVSAGDDGRLQLSQGGAVRLVDSPLELVPEGGGPVSVGEGLYRGRLVLRATPRGTLHVINRVGLEDYLKGVVPAELGPRVYDEVEALKAQAIAARSYALRHRGEYASEGYDLCATPRCQVYGGIGVEHPLSSRAVEETAGEVLEFGGEIADTLFTSTCGGRTEDAANVFLTYATPVPYLVSVPCSGEEPVEVGSTRGPPSRPTTLLGVRGFALLAAEGRTGSAYADLVAARGALRERLGLPKGGGPKNLQPASVYADLVKAARLDAPDLLLEAGEEEEAPADWPAEARAAYALLLRFQLGNGSALPTARVLLPEEAAGLYAALLVRLGGLEEIEGRFVSRTETPNGSGDATGVAPAAPVLTVKTAKGRQSVSLAEGAVLFRGTPDSWAGAARLRLVAGDRVRLLVKDGAAWGLALTVPSAAAQYERESAWIHWTRRATGSELMSRLKERDAARAGTTVRRLEVLERGASGRAKRVRVATDASSFVLSGLEIRFGLGLPENLFTVVEGEASPSEAPGAGPRRSERIFAFYGRGWGHGVGLCQNGAFGLAVAGKSYREILAHYYTGASVVPFRSLSASRSVAPESAAAAGSPAR